MAYCPLLAKENFDKVTVNACWYNISLMLNYSIFTLSLETPQHTDNVIIGFLADELFGLMRWRQVAQTVDTLRLLAQASFKVHQNCQSLVIYVSIWVSLANSSRILLVYPNISTVLSRYASSANSWHLCIKDSISLFRTSSAR